MGPSPQRKGAAFAVIIDRSKKVTFSILLRQEAEAKPNDNEIQLRSISRVEGGTTVESTVSLSSEALTIDLELPPNLTPKRQYALLAFLFISPF